MVALPVRVKAIGEYSNNHLIGCPFRARLCLEYKKAFLSISKIPKVLKLFKHVLLSLGPMNSPHFQISVNKGFRYLLGKRTPPEKQRAARYSKKLASASVKSDWPNQVKRANQRPPALLCHITMHKIDVFFSPRCTRRSPRPETINFELEKHRD